jgi:cyclopropane-fatty-acyl-phospholipid synthase
MDARRVAAELFDSPTRAFAVRLWDGSELPAERAGAAAGRVVLRSPRAVEAFLPPAAERWLAAAYMAGDLELEGDLPGILEAAARWEGPPASPALAGATVEALAHRVVSRAGEAVEAQLDGPAHSPARDGAAVRHHYDLSNDFYRLFLDEGMVYSCAWWERGDESLEEAQRAKLELCCRKLALAAGDRLLDVGCGWGALLEHAVRRHGARVLGITLSAGQLAVARERLARLPRGSDATVLAADWRGLPAAPPYDKVASVGMMEHVGRARLDEYFAAMFRLTRPGGLFLNHAIADVDRGRTTLPWASRRGGGFIGRFIFPDGELLPVGEVCSAAERAGFEVRDVESLREHYERTLLAWHGRLERRLEEAEALVGRERARAWRLYLAAAAVAFRVGRISVFQVLLSRRDAGGRAEGVPRTRAAWSPRDPLAG